jgi:hypothetical protein
MEDIIVENTIWKKLVIIIVGKFIQSKFEFIEGSMNYIEKLT